MRHIVLIMPPPDPKPIRSDWAKTREYGPWVFMSLMAVGFTIVAFVLFAAVVLIMKVLQPDRVTLLLALRDAVPLIILCIVVSLAWAAISYAFSERQFRSKVRKQLCTKCDYDLRGSVAAGQPTCPECGAMIETID